jgi:apolipoprotein D and lipocalin family protein
MSQIIIITIFIMLLSPLLALSTIDDDEQKQKEPKTVEDVSLNRYQGLWYEIAKIPNRFQRKCAWGTTAQYSLRKDGRIDVINRCIDKNGKVLEAKGIAKVVDTISNAKLKVSFVRLLGISLFWGDYWIIGLHENYEYALVGTPGRKYGWILSRQLKLSPEDLNLVFKILREQGYDPEEFEMTSHSSAGK